LLEYFGKRVPIQKNLSRKAMMTDCTHEYNTNQQNLIYTLFSYENYLNSRWL